MVPIASPERSRSWRTTAPTWPATKAPRGSTTACAGAATPRTNRSAAACTSTSNFRDPQPDPEHEPTLFEWAGGFAGAAADDPDLLREIRARRPAAEPAVRRHVPRPPAARRRLARGGLRWPEGLHRNVRRLPAHDLAASWQRDHRSQAGALGPALDAGRRRGGVAGRRRVPGGLQPPTSNGVPASRSRTPRPAPNRRRTCPSRAGGGSATPPPVAGLRACAPSEEDQPVPPARARRGRQLRPAHQAALPVHRPAVDAVRLRPVVVRRRQTNMRRPSSTGCAPGRCRATENGPRNRSGSSSAGQRQGSKPDGHPRKGARAASLSERQQWLPRRLGQC